MFITEFEEVVNMVTRKKAKPAREAPRERKSCACGSCDHPHAHLPGFLLIALGLALLPVSFGFFPQLDLVARGWPILVVLFGFVLIAKAVICASRS
jgi:hypothetical protein